MKGEWAGIRLSREEGDEMKIHLVDGTYELFRNHFGAPPRRALDGREVGATNWRETSSSGKAGSAVVGDRDGSTRAIPAPFN